MLAMERGEGMHETIMYRASLLAAAQNELTEMEMAFADFQGATCFSPSQIKRGRSIRDVLSRLRELIGALEQDSTEEHLAS
jgi:hypothetical protein